MSIPALSWIERDRREPDKVLANLLSARRQVFDVEAERDRYREALEVLRDGIEASDMYPPHTAAAVLRHVREALSAEAGKR